MFLQQRKNAHFIGRFLVPVKGLEPPRAQGTADFESTASTNSATPALYKHIVELCPAASGHNSPRHIIATVSLFYLKPFNFTRVLFLPKSTIEPSGFLESLTCLTSGKKILMREKSNIVGQSLFFSCGLQILSCVWWWKKFFLHGCD